MLKICCPLLALIWCWNSALAQQSPDIPNHSYYLSADPTPQVVFEWSKSRCDSLDFPDSPARAWRKADGSVVLFAAHIHNIPLAGKTIGSLMPDCQAVTSGLESDDVFAFDDRVWLQAILPLPNHKLFGLMSNEYMGSRHAGACDRGSVTNGACWYSSITTWETDSNSLRFHPTMKPRFVFAASSHEYSADAKSPSGFFSVSNIVKDGPFRYVFSRVAGVEGQKDGNCLFRSSISDPEIRWSVLDNGLFRPVYSSDKTNTKGMLSGPHSVPCDVVGKDTLQGAIRSVFQISDHLWIAVFSGHLSSDKGSGVKSIVLYSTTHDFINWSSASVLLNVAMYTGQKEPGTYYQYPSLLDEKSSSGMLDTFGGQLYLYLTRFNFTMQPKDGSNRDLVRFPVRVNAD